MYLVSKLDLCRKWRTGSPAELRTDASGKAAVRTKCMQIRRFVAVQVCQSVALHQRGILSKWVDRINLIDLKYIIRFDILYRSHKLLAILLLWGCLTLLESVRMSRRLYVQLRHNSLPSQRRVPTHRLHRERRSLCGAARQPRLLCILSEHGRRFGAHNVPLPQRLP